MITYKVIKAPSEAQLEELVHHHLKYSGWMLQGGVSIATEMASTESSSHLYARQFWFTQAVIHDDGKPRILEA